MVSGGSSLGHVRACAAIAAGLAACAAAAGEHTLSADVLADKLRGMWMGQLLGNYAGRGTVPGTSLWREGYVVRGGGDFDIGWQEVLATPTWVADDDTSLEYMYLSLLKDAADPGPAAVRDAWVANVPAGGLYFANRQARWLMAPPPVGADLLPPETGTFARNLHAYAIDAQIATETTGALLPGMPQAAADLCRPFAEVTNEGFPVHAAQFYAAMYAVAAFESDVESIVTQALGVVPASSRTREVIEAVRARYESDKAAGNLSDPNAWRGAQTLLYDRYGSATGSNGRYRGWIESTVNVGLTTMAVLYGQGDFTRTVEIGVLGGYDADCNPATAGGVIGLARGYRGADDISGIVHELPMTPGEQYDVRSLLDVGTLTTVSAVTDDLLAAAERQILAAGGSVNGDGPDKVYTVPADPIRPPEELPDPIAPAGLVGRMLAAGGSVEVSASMEVNLPTRDRLWLGSIIDGVTDVRYNGHLAYWTRDGEANQPEGGDYYQLEFSRPVTVRSLVFYEGDTYWQGSDCNPRTGGTRGGYFLDLTVEVLWGEAYVPVEGLVLSEPLDANVSFQRIEMDFEPVCTDTIRIRGRAGGDEQFTTILELEAFGALGAPGDADEDGEVGAEDLALLEANFGRTDAHWSEGDFNFDGLVDHRDYLAYKHGAGMVPAVPEPGAAVLFGGLFAAALLRKRRPFGQRGGGTPAGTDARNQT